MQKGQLEYNSQTNKSWLWSDCKLILHRFHPNQPPEESYQNLQAQVHLESDDIDQPFIPQLQFQKQFLFHPLKGFYWKKSKPLPPLTIKLQKTYFDLLHQDEQIIMIYCELTVAYPKRKDTHFYLQEIFTVGEKKKLFSDKGQVIFDGIVLKECSEKKLNRKFLFVVSICASSLEENRIILKSLISTAFFSQSMRIIRNKKQNKQLKTIKLVSPSKFLRPLSRPKVDSKNQDSKQSIVQFLKFLNIFSSHFTKAHPFYVIYQFSDLLKLYVRRQSKKCLDEISQIFFPYVRKENVGQDKIVKTRLKYELKTKNIQKYELKDSKKQKIFKSIKAQFKQKDEQKVQLLITFEQNVLQMIAIEVEKQMNQRSERNFQSQILNQIKNLSKILQKWSYLNAKIDLLKKQFVQSSWIHIEKHSLYEAYQFHYQKLYSQLLKQEKRKKQIMPLMDPP